MAGLGGAGLDSLVENFDTGRRLVVGEIQLEALDESPVSGP